MKTASGLKKLIGLADRRLEIAERNLARAQDARKQALHARTQAKAEFDQMQTDMARARVEVLDRFVGKPTRRVGVNDLFLVLKDQDDSVEKLAQSLLNAHNAFEAAGAHVAEMSKAVIAARVVQQKRSIAFQPALQKMKQKTENTQEREAEEEFGHARRF